jgi:hypothetical protein
MTHSMRFLSAASVAGLILLALSVPASSNPQEPGSGGQYDPLAALKNALSSAGATALTGSQESSINTLIANFRASQAPPTPSAALERARATYENAILSGQKDAALEQIATISVEMAGSAADRMEAQTEFIISVVQVLDSGQISALVNQLGTGRTVRAIEHLAGGGRGPGGGFGAGGGGPMGAPPPMR